MRTGGLQQRAHSRLGPFADPAASDRRATLTLRVIRCHREISIGGINIIYLPLAELEDILEPFTKWRATLLWMSTSGDDACDRLVRADAAHTGRETLRISPFVGLDPDDAAEQTRRGWSCGAARPDEDTLASFISFLKLSALGRLLNASK
jgi:hypothetical protein